MGALDGALTPELLVESLRRPGAPSLFFDGRGGFEGAWPTRVAIRPRLAMHAVSPADASAAMLSLDGTIRRRRAAGGPGGTGIAIALAYDGGALALEVDASVLFVDGRSPRVVGRVEGDLLTDLESTEAASTEAPAPVRSRPRTSLPRDAYLRSVLAVKDHIVRGDIYQANLTQRFEAPFDRDPWALYRSLAAATPAPRSAFLEADGVSLVSLSPEVFVDVDPDGHATTRPIKGTRARGENEADDAAAGAELLASAKDRAELVMIVDLERNDLGRVARLGSVCVPELLALRTYPTVHHLVARVDARLRPEVGPDALLRAVFPGGSITGAPKERAMQILAAIEPVRRGFYTGSLFWFDDDGSTLSSILIRSAVVGAGSVSIGAGGGIVADSDPEAEWMEANAKARSLTRAVGFEPEEAV
jgi:anthranilate/para-aminobenzoate synthase component I